MDVIIQFLRPINQEEHAEDFYKNEIRTLEDILGLTMEELKNDLALPLGSRKKINKRIEEMNGQVSFGGADALEESAIVGFGSTSATH